MPQLRTAKLLADNPRAHMRSASFSAGRLDLNFQEAVHSVRTAPKALSLAIPSGAFFIADTR